MRILDPEWEKFGSGKEKIRIRDKHPGFATLHFTFKTREENKRLVKF
jgi:hypothetical protein